MRITICIGGSILAADGPDPKCVQDIIKTVHKLKSKMHDVLVVVGGGELARVYINAAKKLKAHQVSQDYIGIAATRLNAQLLVSGLGDLTEETPVSVFKKAVRSMLRDKVPVMGGTIPGQTTDAVAAMLAQTTKSELLVFFTDVDGVYTADPRVNTDAKKIEKLTAAQLAKIVGSEAMKPGIKTIMDPVAVKLIQRAKIETMILGKQEIKRLPEIINGAKHTGTIIVRVDE